MITYNPDHDVGALEFWPFDNPASEYQILSGNPETSGRIDEGGAGHTTRVGIWRCTVGAFSCIEQGDELMTVLSGSCRIINHTEASEVTLNPGDTLFIHGGSRVTWEITADLTKVFYGCKPDGF